MDTSDSLLQTSVPSTKTRHITLVSMVDLAKAVATGKAIFISQKDLESNPVGVIFCSLKNTLGQDFDVYARVLEE